MIGMGVLMKKIALLTGVLVALIFVLRPVLALNQLSTDFTDANTVFFTVADTSFIDTSHNPAFSKIWLNSADFPQSTLINGIMVEMNVIDTSKSGYSPITDYFSDVKLSMIPKSTVEAVNNSAELFGLGYVFDSATNLSKIYVNTNVSYDELAEEEGVKLSFFTKSIVKASDFYFTLAFFNPNNNSFTAFVRDIYVFVDSVHYNLVSIERQPFSVVYDEKTGKSYSAMKLDNTEIFDPLNGENLMNGFLFAFSFIFEDTKADKITIATFSTQDYRTPNIFILLVRNDDNETYSLVISNSTTSETLTSVKFKKDTLYNVLLSVNPLGIGYIIVKDDENNKKIEDVNSNILKTVKTFVSISDINNFDTDAYLTSIRVVDSFVDKDELSTFLVKQSFTIFTQKRTINIYSTSENEITANLTVTMLLHDLISDKTYSKTVVLNRDNNVLFMNDTTEIWGLSIDTGYATHNFNIKAFSDKSGTLDLGVHTTVTGDIIYKQIDVLSNDKLKYVEIKNSEGLIVAISNETEFTAPLRVGHQYTFIIVTEHSKKSVTLTVDDSADAITINDVVSYNSQRVSYKFSETATALYVYVENGLGKPINVSVTAHFYDNNSNEIYIFAKNVTVNESSEYAVEIKKPLKAVKAEIDVSDSEGHKLHKYFFLNQKKENFAEELGMDFFISLIIIALGGVLAIVSGYAIVFGFILLVLGFLGFVNLPLAILILVVSFIDLFRDTTE